jgi:acetyltransferase-like isoleucine patch superfamily enzyme
VSSAAWARRLVRWYCMRTGSCRMLYLGIGKPDFFEYAEFLRRHHGMSIGANTSINTAAGVVMDDGLVKIGRDCSISAAQFVTHSGYDRIVRKVHGVRVDSRAGIVVGDRCAIGMGAIVKYGVTIGDDCIVAMGAVVLADVPAGSVVKGNPARVSGTTEAYIARLKKRATTDRFEATLSDANYQEWLGRWKVTE